MTNQLGQSRPEGVPRTALLLALGVVGLAIAIASIADMFSARPYDGIVPLQYGRGGGIEVRTVTAGSPAERAKIRAGECIQGIGRRIVRSSSDASAELRRHKIGEQVNYLVRNGPCVAPEATAAAAPARSCAPSSCSSPPSGSAERPTCTRSSSGSCSS